MNPLLVAGESLVDVVVPATGETFRVPGGSPMNVAVGLARLEIPAVLVTQLGDDEDGRLVTGHLAASGVELAPGSVEPGRRTSTATAHLDDAGSATYTFDLVWELPARSLPSEPLAVHVGSLGASLEPGRQAVADLVRQASVDEVFVSYDLNARPAFVTDAVTAWRDVLEIAGGARLVKMSDEDAMLLQPGVPVEEVAAGLLASSSTELVVVTEGARGARGFSDGGEVHASAPVTELVDTVGAGDAFMSALLAVLVDWDLTTAGAGALRAMDGDRVRLLLAAAARAASMTCERAGANPPTRRELPPTWPVG